VTICVYAVALPPDRRIAVGGLGGERLRPVTVGRVTAIVGELTRPPRATPAALRKYSQVVQSLSERLPAILPARFGTCVQDLIELTFILQSRQQTLLRNLRDVRGRAQMTGRIIQSPHPTADASPSNARTGSGAEYLRARAAAAASEKEVVGFAPVRAAVRRWIRDERVEKKGPIASVYHLVPRGQAEKYRRTLEHAAREAGLRLTVSGPWPPYAFSTSF
jgi:Gas vesicle synthesis protein GvpL/GvpF